MNSHTCDAPQGKHHRKLPKIADNPPNMAAEADHLAAMEFSRFVLSKATFTAAAKATNTLVLSSPGLSIVATNSGS